MFHSPTRFRSRLAAATLPLLFAFGTASTLTAPVAHAQAAGAMAIGVIDEEKLADGYTAYKNAIDTLDKRAQTLDSQIPAREYLSDAEGKAFDALIVVASPSAAQNTQLQTLIKSGLDKRASYMGLIGKQNKTPKDLADIKALQDQAVKNGPLLRAVSETLLAAIRKQQEDTDKLYATRADAAIAAVAKDKNFAIIVRQKALAWWAPSHNITDDVIKRLNATK